MSQARSGDGRGRRPPVAALRRERDEARAQVARLKREAARLRRDLRAIHRSRMWAAWMVYLRLRAVAAPPLRALAAPFRRLRLRPLVGRLRRGTARAGRFALRAVLAGPHAAGFLFLLGHAAATRLAARLRRPPPLPPEPALGAAAGGGGRRPRVLLVSPYSIYPPNHGGGVRLFNLVRLLSRDCDLYLLIFVRAPDDPEQRRALAPYAVRVDFHHWRPAARQGFWGLAPPNAQIFASRRVAQRIRELVGGHAIDVVQLEYTELGQYAAGVDGARVVLTEHDVAARQHWRRRRLGFHRRFPEGRAYGGSFADWLRVVRYELASCRAADQIHAMSAADGEFLAAHLPDGGRRIRVVPNAVDTAFYQPPRPAPERRDVLYVGNFQNLPNVDAFEFLMEEIWPLVRRACPQVALDVVGAHPSPRVLRFAGRDGVRVVGEVPQVRPYYHDHRLMVAPIRAGSGTRLKILEAFAAGLPVVSTPLGAEGIEAVDGEHLLLAAAAADFARAVVRLLGDEALCRRLARSARGLVVRRYDWEVSARRTVAAYRELMAASPGQETVAGSVAAEGAAAAVQGPAVAPGAGEGDPGAGEAPLISIVIPTLNGGGRLGECLEAISRQRIDHPFEVVCVDSGSSPADLRRMASFGVRIRSIDRRQFNHGLTRDFGAEVSRGDVLVFLNQDAVPCDPGWLAALTAPLLAGPPELAAVQGGMREVPAAAERFYWDSCGQRFYFTRESRRWVDAYSGIGFSTVNAALRRQVWRRHPFGWAPIMEDKKWQRQVVEAGYAIAARPAAAVYHTHNYRLRPLVRRCLSEGLGWRNLGESYSLGDMVRDLGQARVYADLARGLARGRIRSPAELLFPWLRPFMVYWGNRWAREVKL
jgi:glycosyltransferase involved in cell wall biosynthesis